MIGAAIGAGLSAAGNIYGAINNRNAMREYLEKIDAQRAQNQAWFDRRYNEDPLARASAVRLMTEVGERIKRSNRAADGARAVIGGTEESVAATRQANAEALANTASQIAANADARRDSVEAQYRAQDNLLAQQQANLKYQKAQNIAAATQGLTTAAASMAVGLDSPSAYENAATPGATAQTADFSQIDTSDLDKRIKTTPLKSPFTS